MDAAQVQVGIGGVWFELDGLLEGGKSLIKFAEISVYVTEIEIGIRIVGIYFNCSFVKVN